MKLNQVFYAVVTDKNSVPVTYCQVETYRCEVEEAKKEKKKINDVNIVSYSTVHVYTVQHASKLKFMQLQKWLLHPR